MPVPRGAVTLLITIEWDSGREQCWRTAATDFLLFPTFYGELLTRGFHYDQFTFQRYTVYLLMIWMNIIFNSFIPYESELYTLY